MKKIIIGNWKMYKTTSDINIFKSEFEMAIDSANINVEYGIAVPSIYLCKVIDIFRNNKNIKIYAQDAHYKEEGAYTGNISYKQLLDCNVYGSIIGHSERRAMFNDTDEEINKKVLALSRNDLSTILCVGETLLEYQNKISVSIVINQLKKALNSVMDNDVKNVIIAYEPIWAIGTGIVPKPEEVYLIIKEIRKTISELYNPKFGNSIKVLYGGSVNAKNINDFLKLNSISGFLVGSASLKGSDFAELLELGGKDA